MPLVMRHVKDGIVPESVAPSPHAYHRCRRCAQKENGEGHKNHPLELNLKLARSPLHSNRAAAREERARHSVFCETVRPHHAVALFI
jgi:hypothetical protein